MSKLAQTLHYCALTEKHIPGCIRLILDTYIKQDALCRSLAFAEDELEPAAKAFAHVFRTARMRYVVVDTMENRVVGCICGDIYTVK